MWPDWVKAIQLKPRFLFGLWLLGALVLACPSSVAEFLGLAVIRDRYRPWVGLGTLAAFAFWLVQLVPWIRDKRHIRAYRTRALEELDGLSPRERFLLQYCVIKQVRTVYLEIDDGAANALCSKGLMRRVPGVGDMWKWPFTLPGFVWDYLCANPQSVFSDMVPDDPELLSRIEQFERRLASRRP